MARPLISLLHPTARVKASESFPRGWRDACAQFFSSCDHPENVEYVISVHESRWFDFWGGELKWNPSLGVRKIECEGTHYFIHFERWGAVKIVKNTGRDCVVDQLNCAAAASSGSLLVGVMDDLRAPEHWDTLLLISLMRRLSMTLGERLSSSAARARLLSAIASL